MIICHRTLIEILPLQDLYSIYHMHKRLKVFVRKGRECVICGRFGTLLLVTLDNAGQRHVDLYTDDFVLMTVDHIIPKAVCKKLGWSGKDRESLDNKQTMCYPCNTHKGDKVMTNEEYRKIRVQNGYPNTFVGVEVIRELVHNEGVFSKKLKGKHEAIGRTGRTQSNFLVTA